MSASLAWIALSLTDHVGSKTLRALLAHFNHDLDSILTAEPHELRRVPGVGPRIAQGIRSIDLEQVERAVEDWAKAGVSIITYDDPAFPACLKELDDTPPTLFVRGRWTHTRAAAVVGTRSPSQQGIEAAARLAQSLASQGYLVVSGLARGIDQQAHLSALAVPDEQTLAVLGCGVLNIYPPENHSLAELIVRHGALVSEVAPSLPPSSPRLVARNRIISGLSEIVFVVETGVEGGAMHAARRAYEQGRRLVALDNARSGNRDLIDSGVAVPLKMDLSNLTSVLKIDS